MFNAIGNIAGALINRQGQKEADERYNQGQKDIYNLQHQNNIGLWQMQNEYNDPKNQMDRLKSAGLNMNLMYGKGGIQNVGGQSGSAPQAPNAPQFKSSNRAGAALAGLSAYQDIRLKKATADKTEAEKNLIDDKDKTQKQQTALLEFQNLLNSEFGQDNAKYKNNILSIQSSIATLTKDYSVDQQMHGANKAQWDAAISEGEISRRNDQNAAQLKKIAQEIELMKAKAQTEADRQNILKLEEEYFFLIKVVYPGISIGTSAISSVVNMIGKKGIGKVAGNVSQAARNYFRKKKVKQ